MLFSHFLSIKLTPRSETQQSLVCLMPDNFTHQRGGSRVIGLTNNNSKCFFLKILLCLVLWGRYSVLKLEFGAVFEFVVGEGCSTGAFEHCGGPKEMLFRNHCHLFHLVDNNNNNNNNNNNALPLSDRLCTECLQNARASSR